MISPDVLERQKAVLVKNALRIINNLNDLSERGYLEIGQVHMLLAQANELTEDLRTLCLYNDMREMMQCTTSENRTATMMENGNKDQR